MAPGWRHAAGLHLGCSTHAAHQQEEGEQQQEQQQQQQHQQQEEKLEQQEAQDQQQQEQQQQEQEHQQSDQQQQQQQQRLASGQPGGAAAGFQTLGVAQQLLPILGQTRINTPTPVQVEAWPAVLSGRNVAIQSPTGTGKTLSYLLPLMTRVAPWSLPHYRSEHPVVLVLCPTQELCVQVIKVARKLLGRFRGCVQPIVGGANPTKQREALRTHKPWLVAATPGRLSKVLAKSQLLPDTICRPAPWPGSAPEEAAAAAAAAAEQPPPSQQQQLHDAAGQPDAGGGGDRRSRGRQAHPVTLVFEEADRLLSMDDFLHLLPLLSRLGGRGGRPTYDVHDYFIRGRDVPPTPGVARRPASEHLQDVLRRYQTVMVSASMKASTLQAAPSWVATQPITIMAPGDSSSAGAGGARAMGKGGHGGLSKREELQQMLPDTITHLVLTYAPDRLRPEDVAARCLLACAARGDKVLVFVGAGDSPLLVAQRIRRVLEDADQPLALGALFGAQSGPQRRSVLEAFNAGRLDALVTNDAFGLGLDYAEVDVVMPLRALAPAVKTYIARAGRTGRMGRPGTVLAVIPQERLVAHRHQIKKAVDGHVKEMSVRYNPSLRLWKIEERQTFASLAQGRHDTLGAPVPYAVRKRIGRDTS